MIIKGKSRAGPGSLATHLGNAEKNEVVQLVESRGTIASDLRGALVEMDTIAAGTKCQKPLYHAAISPEPPHRLTDAQRMEAVDVLEKKLGLEGHARVIVLHEKLGREHVHVVWSRIDVDHMRSVSDSHNYRKHEEVARDLERSFGHERVQGAHAERDGGKRPDRTPSRSELRQEERTGITGKQVKQEVSALFRASDGPEAFKAALTEKGYQLAKGDRRDLVIVDQAGGIHSLARRIDTMKAADLRAFMAPLDRSNLPDTSAARAAVATLNRKEQKAEAETELQRSYGRSGSYVSQSQAALRDHTRRQAQLDRNARADATWDAIEAGEKERAKQSAVKSAADPEPSDSSSKDDLPVPDRELSESQLARLDRLRAAKAEYGQGPPRDRQNEAPGGGRTRGR